MGVRGELYSTRVSSEKRTYFFNVKENRLGDVFLNIVESKKDGETDFERHQIMVYQEEMELFLRELTKAASVVQKHKELGIPNSPPERRDGEKRPRASRNAPPSDAEHVEAKPSKPESLHSAGGKVTRISRKSLEQRSKERDAAGGNLPEESH